MVLDITLGPTLLKVLDVVGALAPALVGSGFYMYRGPFECGWNWKTFWTFFFSVLFGYAGGELGQETSKYIIAGSWAKAVLSAIVSMFSVEFFERGYDRIPALWDKLFAMIPSWEQLRELLSKGKPNNETDK